MRRRDYVKPSLSEESVITESALTATTLNNGGTKSDITIGMPGEGDVYIPAKTQNEAKAGEALDLGD